MALVASGSNYDGAHRTETSVLASPRAEETHAAVHQLRLLVGPSGLRIAATPQDLLWFRESTVTVKK